MLNPNIFSIIPILGFLAVATAVMSSSEAIAQVPHLKSSRYSQLDMVEESKGHANNNVVLASVSQNKAINHDLQTQKQVTRENLADDTYSWFFERYHSFDAVMQSVHLQHQFMHDVHLYRDEWKRKRYGLATAINPMQDMPSDDQFADNFEVHEVANQKLEADAFVNKVIEYESQYVDIAHHNISGLTYDGYWLTQLMELSEARNWSAASKEAQELALFVKVLSNNEDAKKFIDYEVPANAFSKTLDLLETKINAYMTFAQNFPVFGGSLPWFEVAGMASPSTSWRDRTPGLDNGEFYFTIYTIIKTLGRFSKSNDGTQEERNRALLLSTQFGDYFYGVIVPNAKILFWDPTLRKIRAEIRILNPDLSHIQADNYANNTEQYYLDDPYEGMMMRMFLSLFSEDMTQLDKDSLWSDPRAAYTAVGDADGHGITWKGFWNSAHEEWMWFNFPLFGEGFEVAKKIFEIRQKRRMKLAIEVADAVGEKHGLQSSINTGNRYTSGLGMRGTPAFQPLNFETWYTPSAAWPVILNDVRRNQQIADPSNHKFYGLAWLLHMLKARGNPMTSPDMSIQGPYGFGESYSDVGQLTHLKTADGSFLVYVAMLGGIGDEMKEGLIEDRKWDVEDYGFKYYMQPQFHNTFGRDAGSIPDPVPYSDALLPTQVVQLDLAPAPPITTIDRNLTSHYWLYGYVNFWGSGTVATRDENGALTIEYDGSGAWGWGGGFLDEDLVPAETSAFFLTGTGTFQLKLEGDSPDQIFDVTLTPESWTEILLNQVAGESYTTVVIDRITTNIYISDFWYRADGMP